MNREKRVAEWMKTALILLLTTSALFLGWRTGLFNDFFRSITLFGSVADLMRGTAGTAEFNGEQVKEAARPIVIAITNGEGERFGTKYDTDARNAAYDRTSSIIAEALGSAAMPKEISEAEWREALAGQGVFFEYVAPVSLSVLNGWLGSRMPDAWSDFSLRRIFVVFGQDRSRIYFQDYESGLFYGTDTASAAGKAQGLEVYSPNGAAFAFELGVPGAENAPYMLIMRGSAHSYIRAAPAGGAAELCDITLHALGHSNETYTSLPEGDGAVRFVGTHFTIRVDPHGRVTYRRTDWPPDETQLRSFSEAHMIERARIVVDDTIGTLCGDAEVLFESTDFEFEGTGSVFFGYYMAGGRVHLHEDGYAARVTFSEGAISDVELNFRMFTFSGEYVRLLPERQALAAADGEFMLSYFETGAETLLPSWVKHSR